MCHSPPPASRFGRHSFARRSDYRSVVSSRRDVARLRAWGATRELRSGYRLKPQSAVFARRLIASLASRGCLKVMTRGPPWSPAPTMVGRREQIGRREMIRRRKFGTAERFQAAVLTSNPRSPTARPVTAQVTKSLHPTPVHFARHQLHMPGHRAQHVSSRAKDHAGRSWARNRPHFIRDRRNSGSAEWVP